MPLRSQRRVFQKPITVSNVLFETLGIFVESTKSVFYLVEVRRASVNYFTNNNEGIQKIRSPDQCVGLDFNAIAGQSPERPVIQRARVESSVDVNWID